MAELKLTKGHVAIVDEDCESLKYKWCAHEINNKKYVYGRRRINGIHTALHRFVAKAGPDDIVDHINHNTLDNRSCNLRLVNASENAANNTCKRGKSGYIGTYELPYGGKYKAEIKVNNKCIHIGTYNNAIEAAKAFDAYAYKIRGEFYTYNFPEELNI